MKSHSLLQLALIAGLAAAVAAVNAQSYSWQQPHATVVGTGDLLWAPQPFSYSPGGSVVYIDYEGGSDSNTGASTGSAFKHHPWDPNATGNAAATNGIHTYVFKRGVIYRGTLTADESGTAGNPIILTADPSWGSGQAMLFGSERVATTWQQCTAPDAVTNLDPTNVWYTDLPFDVVDNPYGSYATWPHGILPQTICELTGDTALTRINLCRAPNWTITDPNDPMGNWWDVTGTSLSAIRLGETFTQTAASDWVGGSVWTQYGVGSGGGANMSTVQQGTIAGFTSPNMMEFDVTTNPMCKFFIENLPQLLDEPNEYYYSKGPTFPRRLYVRLSGDRDPNTATIEVGVRPEILRLVDQHYITVSGLMFGVNNQPRPGTNPEPAHWNTRDGACQAIQLGATTDGVVVSNCIFRYVNNAIAPRRDDNVNPTYYNGISITDNDIAYCDGQAITLGTKGVGKRISVLRNKLYFVGFRQTSRNYSAVPAINVVTAASAEVAGNIVDYCAGTGINTTSGTGSGGTGNQVRVLVHHNKVTNSLLALNDYGGIEGWQEGPSYFYSNISGNARGYRHFSGENVYNPWGHAIYFDHAHRHYAVNNIVYGLHNSTSSAADRNNSGFMQAVDSDNTYVNNTIYRLYRGFCSSSGRSIYVGNLLEDCSYRFHSETQVTTDIAYAKNVYHGSPLAFNDNQTTFSAFQTVLSNNDALSADVGLESSSELMLAPSSYDFRPSGDAIGNGAKHFLAWNLPDVVGEWNFYARPRGYATITSDDSPMGTDGNTLNCPGATANDFVAGDLENWTNGALHFDGSSTYCTSSSSDFNVTTGNLIIEAYLRTSGDGVVVSKGSGTGYQLDISSGMARIVLSSGGQYTRSSAVAVADNNWHHIVAEVDRTGGEVNMFVDGALSNGTASGAIPSGSLSNSTDLTVGRDAGGANYFSGDLDFLRVAKGSFDDGETSYDELYAWEFDGPGVRDFIWQLVSGARDAGALQYNAAGVRRVGSLARTNVAVGVRYLNGAGRVVVTLGDGLAKSDPVRLTVLNAAGRVVWDRQTTAGALGDSRSVDIDGSTWAHGVYLLRVTAPGTSRVARFSVYR